METPKNVCIGSPSRPPVFSKRPRPVFVNQEFPLFSIVRPTSHFDQRMLCVLFALGSSYPIGSVCDPKNRIYDCGSELLCVFNVTGEGTYTCQGCDAEHDTCASDIAVNYFCRKSSKKGEDGSVVHICRYEPLIHKWEWRLIVCMVVMFFVGVLVSGVGIGGGALFVPAMQLVGGFPAEYAIASSNPMIFGGSLAVTIFNFKRKHPDFDRPLINYNVAAIIEPISWLGTIVGVIMNGVSPEWFLYLAQVLLFSYTAYTTFVKGVAEYRKIKKAKQAAGSPSVETAKMEETLKDNAITEVLNPDVEEKPDEDEKELSEIDGNADDGAAEPKKKAFSPVVVVVLFAMWAVFVVLPFIRGGNNSSSIVGIEFCSWLYWVVTFVPFPLYIFVSGIMIKIAKKYPVIGKDANLSVKQITLLVVFGVVAGVASGFLGVGGGVVKGPLLLLLGIAAEEMAATSSFLVLLTSGITSIQFMAFGTMPYEEFGIYSAFGFVSFLFGVYMLKVLIQKTGRRDILLHILGSVIALSCALIVYMGVDEVIRAVKNKEYMGFKPYCR